jgi:hypothetical protein
MGACVRETPSVGFLASIVVVLSAVIAVAIIDVIIKASLFFDIQAGTG